MIIVTNKIQCNKCKQILESHQEDNIKFCKCNTISINGGTKYLIRTGKSTEYTELSEFKDDDQIIKTGGAK